MNFEKNFLVWISLGVSIAGLVMIYMFAKNVQPEKVSIESIDASMMGRTVTTEGHVVSKSNHEAGHVFISIGKGKVRIQVPIFSSVASRLEREPNVGQKISVTGSVDEYRGQLQIIPRKMNDIVILHGN